MQDKNDNLESQLQDAAQQLQESNKALNQHKDQVSLLNNDNKQLCSEINILKAKLEIKETQIQHIQNNAYNQK